MGDRLRPGSFSLHNLRWLIAGLLFFETVLNYIDLQTLSVLAPLLKNELKMTDTDYAHITQSFQIAYMVMFLVGGWIVDRLGARRGMALAIGWWSLAEMLHAFARGPMDLICCRFLFGLAYPGAYLAAAKAVSEWYPSRERGLATGVYTAGATVGATVAPPLVVLMSTALNWRWAFVASGAAGMVYVVAWLILYRPPGQHHWITEREREYIASGQTQLTPSAPRAHVPVSSILRSRYFWAVALGRMIGDNPWVFYVMWVPMFLSNRYGLTLTEIGFVGWIPFLFADAGSLGGGWLSGRLIRRGWPVMRARLLVMFGCACVLLLTFALGMVSSTFLIITLLGLLMCCTMAWMVNLSTIPVDAFPEQAIGRVVGMTTMAAILGQFALTGFIGYSFDHHQYQPLFILMSFAAPVAYGVIRLVLPKTGRSISQEAQDLPAV